MKKLLFTVLFFAHIQTIKTIDDGNINQSKNENSFKTKEKISQEYNEDIVIVRKVIEKPSAHKISSQKFKIIKKLGGLSITLFTLFSIVECWNIAQSIAKINYYLERHLLLNSLYKKIDWLIFINCMSASAFIVSILDDFLASL